MKKCPLLCATLVLASLVSPGFAENPEFYKDPSLFSTRPSEKKSLQNIKRFGPVGMGIDLIQPAFTMRIANVEEGSPAAATGKLKTGQIIESINGQKLEDIDPRIQLAGSIEQAEATRRRAQLHDQGRGGTGGGRDSRCSAPTARPGR